MRESFTIHDLPKEERPRERVQRFGIEALSAQELLELIIGRGIPGESVAVTAQNLLGQFRGLEGLEKASIGDLTRVKGIGLAKATQIKAAFEIANRLENKSRIGQKIAERISNNEKLRIKNPRDLYDYIISKFQKGRKKEYFLLCLLNTRNELINIMEISRGSLNTSIVHPREVFREAMMASAASIILVHNHPSGDCTPSSDDIELTKRLCQGGEVVGIDVIDHIIVSDGDFLSMKSKGLI